MQRVEFATAQPSRKKAYGIRVCQMEEMGHRILPDEKAISSYVLPDEKTRGEMSAVSDEEPKSIS